jgi:hypothetical protein
MARQRAERVTAKTNIRNKRVGGINELAIELGVDYTRASSMIYRAPGNGAPGPLPEKEFPPLSMGRLYDLDKWAEWFRDKYVPETDDAPVA